MDNVYIASDLEQSDKIQVDKTYYYYNVHLALEHGSNLSSTSSQVNSLKIQCYQQILW